MRNLVFCLLLWQLVLLQLVPQACAGQINAFIYHRFDETRYPSTNIAAEVFASQLEELQRQRYEVLSLGEIVRRLQAGEALPEKGAAIAVDDAFSSFLEVGMPIIRRSGFPVTLFVNTDAVGTHGYLDWQQLRDLQAEGVEIGNHTASHAYLVEKNDQPSLEAWQAWVKDDIGKAEALFRQELGKGPKLFAYPYGEYTPQLAELIRELGFAAAFAQQSGVIHDQHELFSLPRFPMGGPFAILSGFKNKLAMKPLLVKTAAPVNPVISVNPPELLLQIIDDWVDPGGLNCFVQGENSCQVTPMSERDGWFRVVAERPLTGRRNKYTLTGKGKDGGWHWFSQLWVRADDPMVEFAEE